MRCGACGAANDPGRSYCGSCAHRLGDVCPVCQFLNAAGIRFCGGCAGELPAAPDKTAVATAPVVVEQRPARVTAALFDDLQDLAPETDPAAAAGQAATVADPTQGEIDGFFQRLILERTAVSHATAAPSPGRPRCTPP